LMAIDRRAGLHWTTRRGRRRKRSVAIHPWSARRARLTRGKRQQPQAPYDRSRAAARGHHSAGSTSRSGRGVSLAAITHIARRSRSFGGRCRVWPPRRSARATPLGRLVRRPPGRAVGRSRPPTTFDRRSLSSGSPLAGASSPLSVAHRARSLR
jgi:hypothetical protein